MHIESVCCGKARPIRAKSGFTGIFKQARLDAVLIGREGLEGDVIVDRENHGGEDQAVYVFTRPYLDWWSAELGQDLPAGTFGENLVLSGLESGSLNLGDRLAIGDVVLEVTGPRVPCATLAARMGDPHFLRKFARALRPGFYCRVIKEGVIGAGMAAEHSPYIGVTVSIAEALRHFPFMHAPEDVITRLLASPGHRGMIAYLRDMQPEKAH